MKRFLAVCFILSCASTPKGKAHQAAVIQKTAVDGVGQAYLQYCEIVRKPKCVAADEAAADAGAPQTKEDRIACLRPCDSATATTIREAVDVVRTAQTALFLLLKRDDVTEDELAKSRAQLRTAAQDLMRLLEDKGIITVLGDAVGGISG